MIRHETFTPTQDWHGSMRETGFSASLSVDHNDLTFSASWTSHPLSHPEAKPGEFLPELWRYDCAELFLSAPNRPYLEINLAPNAAWWAAWFESPRKLAKQSTQVIAKAYSKEHCSNISIPLSELAPLGDLSLWRWNMTLIAHTPQQRFYSASPLAGTSPDFHQPENFSQWSPPQQLR